MQDSKINKIFIFINIRHTSQAKRMLHVQQHVVMIRYGEKKTDWSFFPDLSISIYLKFVKIIIDTLKI
ncbi:hypothetical protein QUF70_07625, partial [Desulfobacterales bacterium HSG17]|nr:hypothetical protein [Desulfobacterales bacterium HSG17]